MTSVPVKDGKNCVFRVVRVSGTIKKAEEEAIRRARDMILKAMREAGEKGDSTLDDMFGTRKGKATPETTKDNDVSMVDRSDSEDEEEVSDGDG
jgi:ribonuclease P/MRP protein subunit POP5